MRIVRGILSKIINIISYSYSHKIMSHRISGSYVIVKKTTEKCSSLDNNLKNNQ